MRERGGACRSARAQSGTRVRARVSGRGRGAAPSGAVSRCCAALTACDRRLVRIVRAVGAALRNACVAACACVWCSRGWGGVGNERAAEKVNDQRGGCERWGPTLGAARVAWSGHAKAGCTRARRRHAGEPSRAGGAGWGCGSTPAPPFFFFFLPRDAAEGHGSARRPPWCTRTTARSRLSGDAAGGRDEGVRQRTCELARAQGVRAARPARAPASPAPQCAPRRPQLPRAHAHAPAHVSAQASQRHLMRAPGMASGGVRGCGVWRRERRAGWVCVGGRGRGGESARRVAPPSAARRATPARSGIHLRFSESMRNPFDQKRHQNAPKGFNGIRSRSARARGGRAERSVDTPRAARPAESPKCARARNRSVVFQNPTKPCKSRKCANLQDSLDIQASISRYILRRKFRCPLLSGDECDSERALAGAPRPVSAPMCARP